MRKQNVWHYVNVYLSYFFSFSLLLFYKTFCFLSLSLSLLKKSSTGNEGVPPFTARLLLRALSPVLMMQMQLDLDGQLLRFQPPHKISLATIALSANDRLTRGKMQRRKADVNSPHICATEINNLFQGSLLNACPVCQTVLKTLPDFSA